jgi:hypothetical protein
LNHPLLRCGDLSQGNERHTTMPARRVVLMIPMTPVRVVLANSRVSQFSRVPWKSPASNQFWVCMGQGLNAAENFSWPSAADHAGQRSSELRVIVRIALRRGTDRGCCHQGPRGENGMLQHTRDLT